MDAFQIVAFRHCERSEAIQSYELQVTSYFFSTETAPFASGIFPKRGQEKEDAF